MTKLLTVCSLLTLAVAGCVDYQTCQQGEETACKNGVQTWYERCSGEVSRSQDCECGCNAAGTACKDCSCTPDCAGRECGDDGCGGSCGTCYGCEGEVAEHLCDMGRCLDACCPDCTGKECGPDG